MNTYGAVVLKSMPTSQKYFNLFLLLNEARGSFNLYVYRDSSHFNDPSWLFFISLSYFDQAQDDPPCKVSVLTLCLKILTLYRI